MSVLSNSECGALEIAFAKCAIDTIVTTPTSNGMEFGHQIKKLLPPNTEVSSDELCAMADIYKDTNSAATKSTVMSMLKNIAEKLNIYNIIESQFDRRKKEYWIDHIHKHLHKVLGDHDLILVLKDMQKHKTSSESPSKKNSQDLNVCSGNAIPPCSSAISPDSASTAVNATSSRTVIKLALTDVIPQGEPELILRDQVYSLANMIQRAAYEATEMSTFALPTEINLPSMLVAADEFDNIGTNPNPNSRTIALPQELRTDPFLPGMLMAEALRIKGMSLNDVTEEVKSLCWKSTTKTKLKDGGRAEVLAQCMVDGRALERVVIEGTSPPLPALPANNEKEKEVGKNVLNDDDTIVCYARTITLSFHYSGDFKEFSKETPEKQQEFVRNVCQRLEEVTGIPLTLQLINPEGTALRSIEVCEGSTCIMFFINATITGLEFIEPFADDIAEMYGITIPKEKRDVAIRMLKFFLKVATKLDIETYLNTFISWMPNLNSECSWTILFLFVLCLAKARTSRIAT